MIKLLGGFFLILSIFQIVSSANIYDGITNKKIDRTIDLTSQIARHTVSIEAANTGSKSASEYYVAVQQQHVSKLAYLEVFDGQTSLKVTKGEKLESTKDGVSYALYRVDLAKALPSSASVQLTAKFYYAHSMTPFPAAVAQDEKQLVRYYDNHFFFSPYPTTTQTTNVKLPSPLIESKSELPPTSVRGDTIVYGPYEDISPFTVSELSVHFENNKPFVSATSLVKEIEISHWGNVAIEETYELKHDGAKLKGTFSRFDYQRTQAGHSSVVASLKQVLPSGAADVYYRDEIGNISTSHLAETDNGLVMDVLPRYPLFGGWKIGFYFGYNLPTSSYLFSDVSDSSRYMLNTTFGSAFSDLVVDQLILRVILPEGAKNIEVYTPFAIDGQDTATHFTYLDTAGRPVLIVYKYNVVPEHNQFFQVTYNFSQTSLLQEPILLIGAYFLVFLFVMIYSRIPFSIGSGSKVRVTAVEKAEPALLRLKDIAEQRDEQHSALEASLSKFVKSKNSAVYTVEKKAIDTIFVSLAKEVLSIAAELDEVAVELARKTRELEKKEKIKQSIQNQIHDNEIGYKIRRSIQKDAYESIKADFEKQFNVVSEEIENMVSDLTDSL